MRIWSRTGRRPIVAAGSSNGDIEMLSFAAHPSRPSLSLLVNHDAAAREFDHRTGAPKSPVEHVTRRYEAAFAVLP